MLTSVKTKLRRTAEFVQKHQTTAACAVTAVTAVYVTRTIDVRIARDFAYTAGRENGVLEAENIILREFIDSKGLKFELLTEFIPSL